MDGVSKVDRLEDINHTYSFIWEARSQDVLMIQNDNDNFMTKANIISENRGLPKVHTPSK